MAKTKTLSKIYEVPPTEFFQNYSWYSKEDNRGVALAESTQDITPTQEISITFTREIKDGERNTKSIVLISNKEHAYVSAFKHYYGRIYFLSREAFFVLLHRSGVFLKWMGEFLIRWSTH